MTTWSGQVAEAARGVPLQRLALSPVQSRRVLHRYTPFPSMYIRQTRHKPHSKTPTTGVAEKAMRNELSAHVHIVKNPDTKQICSAFAPSLFSLPHARPSMSRRSPSSTSDLADRPRAARTAGFEIPARTAGGCFVWLRSRF